VAGQLIECVANFSEGRDAFVVESIAAAIGSAEGAVVLDRHLDPDHNRSVLTFAGRPEAVAEAAFRGAQEAVARIDLNHHSGAHPRIGAVDVIPFVPLEEATLEDCIGLAESVGHRIWEQLGVPVYLYEAAARRPERARLEWVRRGQFEGLREDIRRDPDRLPDFGGPALHPTAGATAAGARRFLVAYNINLATADLEVARLIAKAVRASSGGLPHVKALGLFLPSRNRAQVSMNLTNIEVTSPQRAFEAVREEAARRGVVLEDSELIGLVPRAALAAGSEWLQRVRSFSASPVLEDHLHQSGLSAG
jgi:glutamate formiminotransferase